MAQTPKLLQAQRLLPPQGFLNHTVCSLCLSALAKRNTLHAFFLLQGTSTNVHPTFGPWRMRKLSIVSHLHTTVLRS